MTTLGSQPGSIGSQPGAFWPGGASAGTPTVANPLAGTALYVYAPRPGTAINVPAPVVVGLPVAIYGQTYYGQSVYGQPPPLPGTGIGLTGATALTVVDFDDDSFDSGLFDTGPFD